MKVYNAGGTQIKIHPLALFLCLIISILGYANTLLAYLLTLLIHEAAHSIAATLLRVKLRTIEITPFGGICAVESFHQLKPSRQIILALAGPMANALTIILLVNFFYINITSYFLVLFFRANLIMLLFNLLPVMPMDGGRIIHALISMKIDWRKSGSVLSHLGVASGIGLLAMAGYGSIQYKTLNLSLVLTGCYLIYAASLSRKTILMEYIHGVVASRSKFEHNKVSDMSYIAASSKLTVSDLMMRIPIGKHVRIVVIDEYTLNEIGEIKQQTFDKAIIDSPNVLISSLIV